MGLMQQAYLTYELHQDLAGRYCNEQEPLAPIAHILTRAQIVITIDQRGRYVRAVRRDKKEPKVLIPVTEESAGRTSAPCAHPLCDQIVYVAGYNKQKHDLYLQQLRDWEESKYSHEVLHAVRKYVEGNSLLQDLVNDRLIKTNNKGVPENEKELICWNITGMGENSGECWRNQGLILSYIQYYEDLKWKHEQVLCMVSGKTEPEALQHPKGAVSLYGNAKIISANDNSGFTYRGRFAKDSQALSVGYETSQKAHNALRWIVTNQGKFIGNRVFVCWSPQLEMIPDPEQPVLPGMGTERTREPSDYKKELAESLRGWQETLSKQASAKAVIASFDAATPGRLSVTYYNELQASDFINRLHYWDESCCWIYGKYGVQSPSLTRIVECAYGVERTEKGRISLKVDDRIMKQQIQRLYACRIEKRQMPADLLHSLVIRASSPQSYSERNNWLKVLSTACAVIRKYHMDRPRNNQTKDVEKRKEYEMSLNPDEKDRSYQFGRLLAVLENVERRAMGKEETRETNAMRYMTQFSRRPLTTGKMLQERLSDAYFPRLKPGTRSYYRNLIGEIMEKISDFPESEWNKPLTETFLIGYYLQRNLFFSKKQEEASGTPDDGDPEE